MGPCCEVKPCSGSQGAASNFHEAKLVDLICCWKLSSGSSLFEAEVWGLKRTSQVILCRISLHLVCEKMVRNHQQ